MQFWTQHTLSFKMMYDATCYSSGMGTCHFWWPLLQHYEGYVQLWCWGWPRLAQVLKTLFINVSYHIIRAGLTLMPLFLNRAIRVRLATSIWYDTLMKNCFKNWSQSKADPTFQENKRETLVFVIESTQGRRGQAMSTNREVAESKLLFALFRDVLSTMCTNTRRIFNPNVF